MSKEEIVGKLGGRTITITCLGIMQNDEALNILAEYIAKKIYEKKQVRKAGE